MTGRHVELTRIDGRVAVITGGARGIGAETARVFREAGATVVTWDVGDGADQRVDVTDARAVEAAVAATVAKLGGIDILVNNAGILRDGQLVKMKDGEVVGRMEEAQFDAVISVNLKGVFLCGQAVAPVMIKKGWVASSTRHRWSAFTATSGNRTMLRRRPASSASRKCGRASWGRRASPSTPSRPASSRRRW